jgi:hypothetical protein
LGFSFPIPLLAVVGGEEKRKEQREGFDLEVHFAFTRIPWGWGQEPDLWEPFVGVGTPRRTGEERSRTPKPGVRTTLLGRTTVTVKPATTPPLTQSEKAAIALPFPPTLVSFL